MTIPIPPDALVIDVLTGIPLLLGLSIIAGLLAGKQESDQAKYGNGDKSRENINLIDWLEDAGYGLLGGVIGIATSQVIPQIPFLMIPTFGYAGRVLLMNWAKKAILTSENK